MHAWKDGVDIINAEHMNQTLALQSFALIYEGTAVDSKADAGVTENSLASNSLCARFTLTGVTELTRIELHLDRDGDGADVVVQIRSGMDPVNGVEGTTEIEVVVPKEFIPTTASYRSIPINLTGLTSGGTYWIVVTKAGDSTNKIDWVGEASQDSSYPAYYRSGTSGAWTANNALHFKIYSGTEGEVMHSIYAGTGFATLEYEIIDSWPRLKNIYRYLPPSDGTAGGIRDVVTLSWTDGKITRGVI